MPGCTVEVVLASFFNVLRLYSLKLKRHMKTFIVLFLSLICFAASAQFNKRRASSPTYHTSLVPSVNSKLDFAPTNNNVELKVPYFLKSNRVSQGTTMYNVNSSTSLSPLSQNSDQGYWGGPKVSTSSMNGRFQSVQSFDLQGNFRETKATYQFTTRKKR